MGNDGWAIARDEDAKQIRALQEFVVAHTLLEVGITDFDLHRETVERFERASQNEYVARIVRDTLTGVRT